MISLSREVREAGGESLLYCSPRLRYTFCLHLAFISLHYSCPAFLWLKLLAFPPFPVLVAFWRGSLDQVLKEMQTVGLKVSKKTDESVNIYTVYPMKDFYVSNSWLCKCIAKLFWYLNYDNFISWLIWRI